MLCFEICRNLLTFVKSHIKSKRKRILTTRKIDSFLGRSPDLALSKNHAFFMKRLQCAGATSIRGMMNVSNSHHICCLLDGVPSDAKCHQDSKVDFTCCERRQVLCGASCCSAESKCGRAWDAASGSKVMCCTGPGNPSCQEEHPSPSRPVPWVSLAFGLNVALVLLIMFWRQRQGRRIQEAREAAVELLQ